MSEIPGCVQVISGMQAQANVFPVQTQVVGQTQVIPVQTITSHGQQRNAINGVGVVEIVFRGLCTVSDLYNSCEFGNLHRFLCVVGGPKIGRGAFAKWF